MDESLLKQEITTFLKTIYLQLIKAKQTKVFAAKSRVSHEKEREPMRFLPLILKETIKLLDLLMISLLQVQEVTLIT